MNKKGRSGVCGSTAGGGQTSVRGFVKRDTHKQHKESSD